MLGYFFSTKSYLEVVHCIKDKRFMRTILDQLSTYVFKLGQEVLTARPLKLNLFCGRYLVRFEAMCCAFCCPKWAKVLSVIDLPFYHV